MDNYQKALNYETVVSVLKKADRFCWNQFMQIGNECDLRDDLPYNLGIYSRMLEVDEHSLNEAYSRCRRAFEKLDPAATIIDSESPLWPEGCTEVPFLYLVGDAGLLEKRGISVVGTREPSNRGMQLAREVVDSVGSYGFTIISGLANGIDGVAHIEALAKDFKTIGVIGTPVTTFYPRNHEKLQRLVSENGLLVSQFAPSREVQQYYFMQRNLLMSQIAKGSFVIESRDGGGAVSQARYSERAGKKVFILKETYDNRSVLWPRKFRDPVIVPTSKGAGSAVKKALQAPRSGSSSPKGSGVKIEDFQPSLF